MPDMALDIVLGTDVFDGINAPENCTVEQWQKLIGDGFLGDSILYAHKLSWHVGDNNVALESGAVLPAAPTRVFVRGPASVVKMLELTLRKHGKPRSILQAAASSVTTSQHEKEASLPPARPAKIMVCRALSGEVLATVQLRVNDVLMKVLHAIQDHIGGPHISVKMMHRGSEVHSHQTQSQLRLADNDTIDVVFQSCLVATSCVDGIARLWSGDECTAVLTGHDDVINSICVSHDTRMVATASKDKTVKLWCIRSCDLLQIFTANEHVHSVIFSPDDSVVLAGCGDKTGIIWGVATARQELLLVGHDKRVYSATFSRDALLIATASGDYTARVWSTSLGTCTRVFQGHNGVVRYAAFSPDSDFLVTCSWDKRVKVWDIDRSICTLTIGGHTGDVFTCSFSPDGRSIVTSSADCTAKMWNATDGQLLLSLEGHTDAVKAATFSRDGRGIVTSSSDGSARIWDARSGVCTLVLEGHNDRLTWAVFADS